MPIRASLLAVLAFAALATAADDPPSEFRAELIDGRSIVGKLMTPTIRIKTAIGTSEIEAGHIRRVTFHPADAADSADAVELNDKSVVRGHLLTDRIQIATDAGVESFSPTALRELKAVHKARAGLWALAIGLLTLAAMEIVLGIDNIIFLAIVAGKLPEAQQPRARRLGLIAALGTRLLLLASLSFLLGLTKPLFTLPDLPFLHELEVREVSLRDLLLLLGGLFLIWKSVREMHEKLEDAKEAGGPATPSKKATFGSVLIQIAILDIVFSLDSVITAIGMVDELWVMIVAMVIAMLVMMAFAGRISAFVANHPTLKVLALAFLILIGVMLVAEGMGQHISKGYIYFAMAFAVTIEMLNIRVRAKTKAVEPHDDTISKP